MSKLEATPSSSTQTDTEIETPTNLSSSSSVVSFKSATAGEDPSRNATPPPTTAAIEKAEPLKDIILESGHPRGFKPPIPQNSPYDASKALLDLPSVVYAMDEFLGNKMVESEDYLQEGDEKGERLYFTTGIGLIETVKSLLSYADDDLLKALQLTKHANTIASQHRKRAGNVVSRLSGFISGAHASQKWYNAMNDVELHAELTYAESLFEKALIGIVYSGDWIAFIKEALNMRSCVTVYRALYAWLQGRDSAHSNRPRKENEPPLPLDCQDGKVDPHLRSGIYLGAGMLNVILSLLPGRLLSVMEIFGLGGDRKLGLDILKSAGGWDDPSVQDEDGGPAIGTDKEGVRRPICDLGMLIFHLVLSTFTFEGVDMDFAERVVRWNIRRWPDGIFPLLASGRLSLTRSEPAKAIDFYRRALSSQEQYRNLFHICWWELAVGHLCLWEVKESGEYWKKLRGEATWSKAIYTYGHAACLLELAYSEDKELTQEKRDEMIKEGKELMETVPGLRQRIAGKSIPLEKFVARRARKFLSQKHLVLPAMELGSLFGTIAHAPLDVIEGKLLVEVRKSLARFEGPEAKGEKGRNGNKVEEGWWDDWCLLKFLEGVCLRYLVYPDPAASPSTYTPNIPKDDADNEAEKCFRFIFEHGRKIELDHQLVYMSHFDLGRLLACRGDTSTAKKEFELVLSGKPLEVSDKGKKGKYSLENALHMRTTAAMDSLEKGNKSL